MTNEEVFEYIDKIPDEVLLKMQFAMPWQHSSETEDTTDSDGFSVLSGKKNQQYTRELVQEECWNKFHKNPQMSTAVRGLVGRLSGLGFSSSSGIFQIQSVIEDTETDQRNRLYNFWPKYVGRALIEGELYLCLTCHNDSFVEVDFIDPSVIKGGGDDDTGIIFHPSKTVMPLFYSIDDDNGNREQIPSIFVARYPELRQIALKHKDFRPELQKNSSTKRKNFKVLGGYYRFIVAWDKGFVTRRSLSYLRTVLEWLNYYENLKKYEIDHKKSSGSYLWVFRMTDPRSFKLWLSMTDADKAKTGIMAKKTPGGTLILPPGIELDVKNPNLSKIKDEDTDILQMVGSGLNEPEDIMTGKSRGTFASVKASRGPMSDRVSDEIAYFQRFLIHDFWSNVFFLKSKLGSFPPFFMNKEAVSFDEKGEPKFKNVKRRPEELIDISFPVSEVIDLESRSRALLGVKHGPISETLGIPYSEVAKKLGISGYSKMRLRKATEDDIYPELDYAVDAESLQETVEGEAPKKVKKVKKKNEEE